MADFFFDAALLPQSWARNVRIGVADGRIISVTGNARPEGCERIAGVALPGLPNVHSHTFQRGMAGQTEIRGPAGDSFWSWRQLMYRYLEKLSPDDVQAIAAFAFMEMLEGGFTAAGEFHYLHHDPMGAPYASIAEMSERIAAAASEAGIGLTLLPAYYQYGGFGKQDIAGGQKRFANTPADFLRLVEGARRAVACVPDANVGIAPHSLRAVSPEGLSEVVGAFRDGPVHIHVAEQLKEVEDCIAWSTKRPMQWLMQHADIDARWCLIHATHMTAEEEAAVLRSKAVAGLCPITEASLGDGVFGARSFTQAAGAYAVGSDSNIEITAAGELKLLEYGQRLIHRARNVLTRREGESTGLRVYTDALRGGRQALGRSIGALAAGDRADIVTLNPDDPSLAGVDLLSCLNVYIFVAGKSLIDTVIVGGKTMVRNGRHLDRVRIAQRYVRTMKNLAAA